MSGWVSHDGKGVPADAVRGVTVCKVEGIYSGVSIMRWSVGDHDGAWDWSNYGKSFDGSQGRVWNRVLAYRNPSTTAAVEALKAIARNPERVREGV